MHLVVLCCNVLQCVVLCCNMVQCLEVRCNALQCVAACCAFVPGGAIQWICFFCDATLCNTLQRLIHMCDMTHSMQLT